MHQAVSLVGISPQRPGFDSRSVRVRFMARNIVTTPHSPPEEVSVGQLQTYIDNCPTRCNTKQPKYYSVSSLYMFRVSTTPTIRSTQNCNYSLWYCSYLLPTWPSLATLEGGSCTKIMTSTGGCSYSFVYSCWWVWLTPETCRVNLQNNRLFCVASRWTTINLDQPCT